MYFDIVEEDTPDSIILQKIIKCGRKAGCPGSDADIAEYAREFRNLIWEQYLSTNKQVSRIQVFYCSVNCFF
jgi:hypothetical protein